MEGRLLTMNGTEANQLKAHIRWMIRRDMRDVLAIEKDSFEFPWDEEDFIRFLRGRNCIGMVAEIEHPWDGRVLSYVCYEIDGDQIEIVNLAVAPPARRRGVGRQMVEKLVSKLHEKRRRRIVVSVRESNLPAQLFFQQLGFRATAVLRNNYDESPEDAYLMQFLHQAQ